MRKAIKMTAQRRLKRRVIWPNRVRAVSGDGIESRKCPRKPEAGQKNSIRHKPHDFGEDLVGAGWVANEKPIIIERERVVHAERVTAIVEINPGFDRAVDEGCDVDAL